MSSKHAPQDPGLPLRLKHGIHTIFLFTDSLGTFDDLSAELLEVLRERYPDGLQHSPDLPTKTPLPHADDQSISIAYAKLRLPKDIKSGWVDLKITGKEAVGSKQLKDHAAVAFAFVKEGEAPEWIVSSPNLDED